MSLFRWRTAYRQTSDNWRWRRSLPISYLQIKWTSVNFSVVSSNFTRILSNKPNAWTYKCTAVCNVFVDMKISNVFFGQLWSILRQRSSRKTNRQIFDTHPPWRTNFYRGWERMVKTKFGSCIFWIRLFLEPFQGFNASQAVQSKLDCVDRIKNVFRGSHEDLRWLNVEQICQSTYNPPKNSYWCSFFEPFVYLRST